MPHPCLKDFHPLLFPLAIVVAMIWLSLGTFTSVQIIYVVKGFSLPDYYYGYLCSIFSLGNIMGYILSPVISKIRFINKWRLFFLGYMVAGSFALIISISRIIWLSAVCILLSALSSGASNTVEEIMEQELPIPEYRGKVISFISSIETLGYLIGITFGPISTDIINVRPVIFISAILLFVTSVIIFNVSKHSPY